MCIRRTRQEKKLSPTQRAAFFTSVHITSARTFVSNHANDQMNFERMEPAMVYKYNSNAQQILGQGILENLHMDRFMA